MTEALTALLLGVWMTAGWATPAALAQGQADTERPRPKRTISKETTHVTEPLAVVVEATKRPGYFNPMVSRKDDKGSTGLLGALEPGGQKCRHLAGALLTRAMLHAGEGRHDEAWQDLLACHRLGRLVGRGAT